MPLLRSWVSKPTPTWLASQDVARSEPVEDPF
jgi:hypothetical protein